MTNQEPNPQKNIELGASGEDLDLLCRAKEKLTKLEIEQEQYSAAKTELFIKKIRKNNLIKTLWNSLLLKND